jgi:hypothetical protein
MVTSNELRKTISCSALPLRALPPKCLRARPMHLLLTNTESNDEQGTIYLKQNVLVIHYCY